MRLGRDSDGICCTISRQFLVAFGKRGGESHVLRMSSGSITRSLLPCFDFSRTRIRLN